MKTLLTLLCFVATAFAQAADPIITTNAVAGWTGPADLNQVAGYNIAVSGTNVASMSSMIDSLSPAPSGFLFGGFVPGAGATNAALQNLLYRLTPGPYKLWLSTRGLNGAYSSWIGFTVTFSTNSPPPLNLAPGPPRTFGIVSP